MSVRSVAGERGVTIVEAAFALPILLMFMFALVDLGMWTLNSNQATNAARDGARQGIIDFEGSDVQLSLPHLAIVDAVEQRLDREIPPEDVIVDCLTPEGADIACTAAAVRVDVDRLRVVVDWDWDLVTPVAGILGVTKGDVGGSATMAIIGRPLAPTTPVDGGDDTTTGTTDCVATITSVAAPNSAMIQLKNSSNQLQHAIALRFTTTGTCTNLKVEFESPTGAKVPQIVCGCAPADKNATYLEYSYKGSDNIWSVGSAYVRILDGDVQVGLAPFQVHS